MGYTRVIYTDSTTAECGNVLKALGFEEDPKKSCYVQPDDGTVKIYVVWGKAPYYPEVVAALPFAPRVQVHLKTRENLTQMEFFLRESAEALRALDPHTRVVLMNPEDRVEIPF